MKASRDPWQHTLQLLSDDDNVDLLTEEIISIFSFLLNKILTQFQNLLLCQISLYWLYCTRKIPITRQHEPTRSSPYFMSFPKLAWKWKEEATILKSISEKTLLLHHQRTTKHGQYCSQTDSGTSKRCIYAIAGWNEIHISIYQPCPTSNITFHGRYTHIYPYLFTPERLCNRTISFQIPFLYLEWILSVFSKKLIGQTSCQTANDGNNKIHICASQLFILRWGPLSNEHHLYRRCKPVQTENHRYRIP